MLFAALFGIPKECLPQGWTAFSAYVSAMVQSNDLSVSSQTRSIARRLITGADLWLPVPGSYQDLTVALLPVPIREELGFSLDTAKQVQINRTIALVRRLHPFLPARLRYVGPYQEAKQRLAGRCTPDFVTQMCNRFWIGRTELPKEHGAVTEMSVRP
jgi:uncharacterized protein (DUF2236 family)